MKITDIIKGKVRNVSGELLDEENNYLIKVWGVRGADQPVDDQLTSFIVDAINEKLESINKEKEITYCVEVNRSGIGEENMTIHYTFTEEQTREDILDMIILEDCGYDDNYCKFDYYKV